MTTTQTFRQTEQESSRRQWLRQTMLSSGLLLVPGLVLLVPRLFDRERLMSKWG